MARLLQFWVEDSQKSPLVFDAVRHLKISSNLNEISVDKPSGDDIREYLH